MKPNKQMCPVCKAAISKDKVIPLYGRDSTQQEDPRAKVCRSHHFRSLIALFV